MPADLLRYRLGRKVKIPQPIMLLASQEQCYSIDTLAAYGTEFAKPRKLQNVVHTTGN